MSWLGIGLISQSSASLGNWDEAFGPPRALTPGQAWDGTLGSGFTLASPVPVDPTRTTAKPACRLIVPMNQHFTDTLDVGVIAMANEDGTLINNFGIKEVTFHYEGRVAKVVVPRWNTIMTERGPRTYVGWWVRLRKPSGVSGLAHLYVEAEALDPALQKRVIGPFAFCPVDQQYDFDLEVNPDLAEVTGARYRTLYDAAAYARAQAAHNPRFLITKAGKYQLENGPGGAALVPPARDITGRYTIEASFPGTSIGRNAYTNDDDAIIPSHQTFWRLKGSNITFDTIHMRYWNGEVGNWASLIPGHWFDGVTITTTSPDGKNDMMRGGSYVRASDLVVGPTCFTECLFKDQNVPANGSGLVRGSHFENSSQDLVSNALCVVFSTFDHSDQAFWNSDAVAFSVTVPAGATLERSGGNGGSGTGGGLWTATIGGTPYTFDIGGGEERYFLGTAEYQGVSGVGGYWCADVVDWLNTLPGFSAALSPEFAERDRRAAFLSRPGRKGQGFTLGNGRAIVGDGETVFDIVWCVDTHGDFYQHTRGNLENVIVAFNRAWDLETQCIFLAPILAGGTAATRDVFFVGNAFAIHPDTRLYYDPNAISSAVGRPQDVSHLVIAHNTLANQRFIANFKGARDQGYNLLKNNAFRRFEWNGDATVPAMVDGLLIHEGQTIPADVANYLTMGGTDTLYADPFNGDFTPTPLMRELGFEPAIPFDLFGNAMPDPSAPGAIAALSAELLMIPVGPPAGETLGEAGRNLAGLIGDRIHGGMWLLTDADNNGLWAASNIAGSAGRFTQGNAANQSGIDPGLGAIFGENDQINANLFAGLHTIFLLVRKDLVSTNGHLIPNLIIHSQGNNAAASAQGGARVFIDGVQSLTRNTSFTALDARVQGQTIFREVQIRGLDVATLQLGRAGGGAFQDVVHAAVAIPEFGYDDDDYEGPSLTQLRAAVRDWFLELQPGLMAYP